MNFTGIDFSIIPDNSTAYIAFDIEYGFRLLEERRDLNAVYFRDLEDADPDGVSNTPITLQGLIIKSNLVDYSGSLTSLQNSAGKLIKIGDTWATVLLYNSNRSVVVDNYPTKLPPIQSVSNNLITIPLHGLANNTPIQFYGVTPPVGISEGVTYYVRNPSTNSFNISANVGGTNITLTDRGGELYASRLYSVYVPTLDTDAIKDTIIGKVIRTGNFYTVETFYSVSGESVTSFELVEALPAVGAYEGQVVLYENTIYTWNGLSWVTGAGTSSRTVSLGTNKQAFTYDSNGALLVTDPVQSATITATAFGAAGALTYDFKIDGVGTGPSSSNTFAYTPNASYDAMPDIVTVDLYEDGELVANDLITLFGVIEGSNAVTAILSNEAHTVPAASNGSVTTYAGSGTRIQIYRGNLELQYVSGTPGTGEFSVSASSPSITVGNIIASTAPNKYAIVEDHSAMTADTAIVTYTLNIENSITAIKVQSITKSKQGEPGSVGVGAAAVKLDANTYVITYDSDGTTPSPSGNLTLTAEAQNIDVPWFKFTGGGVGFDDASFSAGSGNTKSKTFAIPSTYFSTPYKFRVDVSDEDQTSVAFDSINVLAVKPGIDAIVGLLTNENHTVVANSDGTGYSLDNAGGTFLVYDGVDNVTTQATFSVIGTNPKSGLTINIGANTGLYNLSGSSWNSSAETFILRASYKGVNIDKVYTISKSRAGNNGSNAQYVVVSGEQTFRFAAGATVPDNPNITLTAQLYGGLTTYDWEYWDGNNWVNLSGTQNASTYSLAYNNSAFNNNNVLRVKCTSGAFQDEITIIKLFDGSDAINGLLTNENHTIPTPSTGQVASYAGAGGTFKVYRGITEVGASFSGTATKNGLTLNINATTGVYSLSGSNWTSDIETFNLSATYLGTTITKVYTISKSKAGTNGNNAVAVKLISSDYSIIYNENNVNPTPSSITLTATAQNLASPFFTFRDGGPTGTIIQDSSSDSDIIITLPANSFTPKRYWVGIAESSGGTILAFDTISVFSIQEASDAYTVIVSNESHSLPASDTGVVSTYVGSGTIIEAFKGATELQYVTGTPSLGQFSISASASNITVGSITPAAAPNKHAIVADHSNMSANSVLITYTINLENLITVVKIQTLTKSLAGTPGSGGVGAAVVKLGSTSYVLAYDINGSNPTPSGNLTLRADTQNISDPWFKFTGGTISGITGGFTDETTFTNGDSNSHDEKLFAVPSTYFTSPYKVRVDVSNANQTSITYDIINIFATKPAEDGADSILAFLTNDSHTVPADSSGVVINSDLTTAGGIFKVYEGINDVTSAAALTILDGTGTTSIVRTQNNLRMTLTEATGVYTIEQVSPGWTSSNIETFTLRATYKGVTLDKVYTISKSRSGTNGSNGTNARAVSLTSNASAITYRSDGTTPAPTSIVFTPSVVNTQGTVFYEYFVNGTSQGASSSTATTFTYNSPTSIPSSSIRVEVQIREGLATNPILARDQITIPVLRASSQGITISLSNEAHTLPRTNTGVIDFAGSGTDINVWLGATPLPYDAALPNSSFRVTSATGSAGLTVGAATTVSTNTRRFANHSGTPTAPISVTFTIEVKNAEGLISTFTRIQSLSFSQQGGNGSDGSSVAQLSIFRRFSSAPTTAPTGGSFNFGTNVLTPPTNWSSSTPSGTDPVYVSVGVASIVGTTGIDNSITWSVPTLFVQNGTTGKSVYTAIVFQRASTPPTTAPTGGSFNFGTNVLTPPSGWFLDVPTGTDPVYGTRFVFSIVGDTGSQTATTWSTPFRIAEDGIDGADGLSTYLASIFRRSSSGLTAPTGGSYNFGTNTLTAPTSWSTSVPTGTDPVYISTALASIQGVTGIDNTLTWSTPVILARNGTDGDDGTAAISGYLTNESQALFAYANGTVVSYAPANGSFVIMSGNSNISSNFDLSTFANPQNLTVSYTNQTYSVSAGFDPNEDFANLIIRATGKTGTAYAGITLDKVFSLSKVRGGYEIVTSLPGSGDPRRFQGNVVFLTTDNKLYRYNGTAWVYKVPAGDIDGAITTTQITDQAITSPKIYAGDVEANLIQANNISTGAVTAAKISVTELSAINANMGTITAGSLNINNKFIVASNGNTTIQSSTDPDAPRLVITDSLIEVYQGAQLRVRLGIW